MAVTIQLRRGTAAAWTSANPILALGEVGLETDTLYAKFGDGSTAWNSLTYMVQGSLYAPKASPTFTGTTASDVAPHNMTTNSAPSPYVASASSSFGVGAEAFRAFQGTAGSNGYWLTAASATGWLQIDLGTASTVVSYGVQVNTIPEATRAPKDWTLEGSNNGSSWTTVDTVTNQTAWSSGETRTFLCDSPGSYRYYRINVTANNGDTYLQIAEMYLYTLPVSPIKTTALTNYASNAAALAGGLSVGDFYRTSGAVMVVI